MEALTDSNEQLAIRKKLTEARARHAKQREQDCLAIDEEIWGSTSSEPVAWLHMLDNTDGIEGNEPMKELSFSPEHPFGEPGRDYDETYLVVSVPLFAISQEGNSA